MPQCHYCHNELSTDDLSFEKCPYCFPEIRQARSKSEPEKPANDKSKRMMMAGYATRSV